MEIAPSDQLMPGKPMRTFEVERIIHRADGTIMAITVAHFAHAVQESMSGSLQFVILLADERTMIRHSYATGHWGEYHEVGMPDLTKKPN